MSFNEKGQTGVMITPCQKEYEEARQEWNRAVQKFPEIIVYCSQTTDIQNAVRFALPDYEKEYYGGNVCRLRQTESRYDPIHVFSFPQAVR
nr:BBE domain-containing protein [uncultured Clostridium sp.]